MPGCSIQVRVTPRANKSEIVGWQEGVLLVRLAAPPVEGAANKALMELLSGSLGIRKSGVMIESGERSRNKRVTVGGLTHEEVRERLRG
jgi:uncharacterized protein (TIGR00251 family)